MNYKDGLVTERLYTRFLKETDAETWVPFFENKVSSRFLYFPDEYTPMDCSQSLINSQLKRYNEGSFGLQAIILKETDEFVGMCGLLLQDVEGDKEIEVGYHFLPKYWGNGYATEAAMLFRDYGFETNNVLHIVSLIHPENSPSIKVATRNCMTPYKRYERFEGKEYIVYHITREEWEQLKK